MAQPQSRRSVALARRSSSFQLPIVYQPATDRRCELVICIASAHGITAISALLAAIDSSFPVPILVAPHWLTRFPQCLAAALETHSSLPVRYAVDGEPIIAGTVYITPADYTISITSDRRVRLSKESSFEPGTSSNALLKSAANVFFNKVAVLLSSAASLGTVEGARVVKRAGGLILSAEEDSITPEERSAGSSACYVDFVLPSETVAPVLESLVKKREKQRAS